MKKEIKVCLLDFDGTLVKEDILTLLCGIAGKEAESQKLNDAFTRSEINGLDALVARINFLAGITTAQIIEFLGKDNFLMPGALELVKFMKANKISTILASGNILPVLEYYQKILGLDYIVGSGPNTGWRKILNIEKSSYPSLQFKRDGINNIIRGVNLKKENIMAIGDGPGDKQMFEMSGYNIAFNPQGGIEAFADIAIRGDLNAVVKHLKSL